MNNITKAAIIAVVVLFAYSFTYYPDAPIWNWGAMSYSSCN